MTGIVTGNGNKIPRRYAFEGGGRQKESGHRFDLDFVVCSIIIQRREVVKLEIVND
jgi:hypothetical protein